MDVAGETRTKELADATDTLNRIIRNVSQKRRRTAHQLILIAEAGGRCQRCDEPYHPFVYDFHHRDPAKKSYSLDRSVFGRKLSELRNEAAKCHLLCANCHREVHTFLDPGFLVLDGASPPADEIVYEPRPIGFPL